MVCDTICTPLIGQKIDQAKKKYKHLKDLDLADGGTGEAVDVEVSIGGDNYWSIVKSEAPVRGKEGPTAVPSKVSYLLSGPAHSVTFLSKSEPNINKLCNLLVKNNEDELTR